MKSLSEKVLLNNATENGPGPAFRVEQKKGWTFYIRTSVAGAATIDIEIFIQGVWIVLDSHSVSSEGTLVIRDDHGHYELIRANVKNYTGGTHSVYATGTTESL